MIHIYEKICATEIHMKKNQSLNLPFCDVCISQNWQTDKTPIDKRIVAATVDMHSKFRDGFLYINANVRHSLVSEHILWSVKTQQSLNMNKIVSSFCDPCFFFCVSWMFVCSFEMIRIVD